MKHLIAEMTVLILLICSCAVSAAGEIPAGITIEGQKMTGTIMARFGMDDESGREEEILVDCMAPQGVYSGEIFKMEARHFSKRDMQKALRAIGQSGQGRFISSRNEATYINTERIEPEADISREEAAEQAVEIALRYFDALGVEVVRTPSHVERPYDYDAYIEETQERLSHMYSDTSVLMEAAKAQWKRTRKYETREAAYTLVKFDVMADGIRIWNQPSYPAGYEDEPDAWAGFGTSVSILVSDSGVIVEASASDALKIKERRTPEEGELERFAQLLYAHLTPPLVLAESWQEALNAVLTGAPGRGDWSAYTEDRPYQNQYMNEPITAYGSRTVITEIYPCLSTISEDEWAMFWHIERKGKYADGCRY